MAGPLQKIRTDQPDEWQEALAEAGAHDFYHTAPYHALAEHQGEGEAVLLVWRGQSGAIALPLLLRPVSRIWALREFGRGLYDATSAYGYSGPVGPRLTGGELAAFKAALASWLSGHSVVSVFSRLHPLLDGAGLIGEAGSVVEVGPTVSIDLTQPPDAQVARYRSNHRRDLRKLRERGFTCRLTSGGDAISEFEALYRETMHRVDAAPGYLFGKDYFARLLDIPGLALMLCTLDGNTCAGAIISCYGDIAQYHLGGTGSRWLGHAPMKLVFDEARQLAQQAGCRWLHLGGGLGAREDALFNFKAGFSPDRQVFRVWRWVIDPPMYQALIEQARASDQSDFFPAYAV